MDSDLEVQQMDQKRMSSLSLAEKSIYGAEKHLMRQFMIMEEEEEVPPYVTVRDLKAWLLKLRCFLEECPEADGKEIRERLMAELTWTLTRRLCLDQMERELYADLVAEKRLSIQLNRKVTLEGLEMFIGMIHQRMKDDVRNILLPVFSWLPDAIAVIQTRTSGVVKPVAPWEHLQITDTLVPYVIKMALDHLLEEPAENQPSQAQLPVRASDLGSSLSYDKKAEAASVEICQHLINAAVGLISRHINGPVPILPSIYKAAAQDTVTAVYARFERRSKSFNMMDFDESFFLARVDATHAIEYIKDKIEFAGSSKIEFAGSSLHHDHFGIPDCNVKAPMVPKISVETLKEKEAVVTDCLADGQNLSKAPEVCIEVTAECNDGDRQSKKEKKGICAFFRRIWKMMNCCSSVSVEE